MWNAGILVRRLLGRISIFNLDVNILFVCRTGIIIAVSNPINLPSKGPLESIISSIRLSPYHPNYQLAVGYMVQGTVTNASNLTWNAIISGSPYFVGKYISVTHYEDSNAADKQYVNVKIENDSTDFFIGFNLRAGINNNTREAFDKVTVHTQGVAFSRSELLAKLIAKGQDYTISNYTSGGLIGLSRLTK
jgi:hypothetical protein